MTADEFKLFRDLIHNECGIFLKDTKMDFLKGRLEKRLKCNNIGSYFRYYKAVTDDNNKEELYRFIDSITINETFFFRNMPQFEILREKVLPDITERKRKTADHTLTLWSAGCSTGEEPFSMAIVAAEAVPDIEQWNFKIIASDISLRCLEIAQAGKYPKEKLKDVPEEYLKKYFKFYGDLYEVKDFIRKVVIFDYHNLMHENGMTNIDVIFCRNVMIYFDIEEQRKILSRFWNAINPGGYLFLGHAESLYGLSNGDFKFLYWNKGTAYKKINQYG